METLRIAMWSGPRNISTAMMRSFENRSDTSVVDEPFYAAYLAATGSDHPGRAEILASQSQDWKQVAGELTGSCSTPVFYQKHMTQHLLPEMDLDFTKALRNCFLIREPRRIIASYAKVRPEFSLEELGFSQQFALFERECERLGAVPPVLDASLTLEDPAAVLGKLCSRLGIAFEDSMLQWPAGARASDGVWGPHWYASVWQSTGFAAPAVDAPEATVPLNTRLEKLCEEAERVYALMREYALRP